MTSWRDDIALARARLAQLEAAETAALTGEQVEQVSGGGESVKFAQRPTSLADLQKALAETRLVIRRLSGQCAGGAIIPVMQG